MNMLSDNLKSYMEKEKLSAVELSDKSHINEGDIYNMCNGIFKSRLVDRFCFTMKISPTSLESPSGFNAMTLFEEYSFCPDKYKKVITAHAMRRIKEKYARVGRDFVQELVDAKILYRQQAESALSGKWFISSESTIQRIINLDEEVASKQFIEGAVTNFIRNRVANYNLWIARLVHTVSNAELAEVIGSTEGSTSLMTSVRFQHIPESGQIALAEFFGVDPTLFRTTFMTKSDFSSPLHKKKESKAPKEPVEEPVEHNSDLDSLDFINDNLVIEDTQDSVSHGDNKAELSIFSNEIQESRLIKMYNHLTPEHQLAVAKMISDYFWKDLD